MASSHVEQIKDRLGIVDVIASYIKLEKAGVNYKAKCPFHNERTPSFMVSPTRNTYYCFGCGAGGDVFSFVQSFEGTDFKGALKTLADRAGVTIAPVDRGKEEKRERLFSALEDATRFFEEQLALHPEAKSYLHGRGISDESTALWRIGYAPDAWRALREHLTARGYTDAELLESGLTTRSEKGGEPYDRFRGRAIFPIFDASERVIAYSGRILPQNVRKESGAEMAKYINSPETILFQKSHVLYGFHRAKHVIRKHDFSILVEGQMDVVLSHQAGFPNTVASSGTSLTREQLSLLSKISSKLVMAFDADAAGLSAGARGIEVALEQGFDVKIAPIPAGSDPADLVKKDPKLWRAAVRGAQHIVDFYLDLLEKTHTDPRKFRLAVDREVVPHLARIRNKIDQAHFVNTVAARLGLETNPVWESVRNAKRPSSSRTDLEEVRPLASNGDHTRRESIERRLLGLILLGDHAALGERLSSIDTKELHNRLRTLLGADALDARLLSLKNEGDGVLYEIEQLYDEDQDLGKEAEDLYHEFHRVCLKDEYDRALRELKEAETKGVSKDVEKALSRCRVLSEALR
jgi:DNA primase